MHSNIKDMLKNTEDINKLSKLLTANIYTYTPDVFFFLFFYIKFFFYIILVDASTDINESSKIFLKDAKKMNACCKMM